MKRGFSLIEVLITIAIFIVLIAAITQLYVLYGRMVSFESLTIGASLSSSSIVDAVTVAGRQAVSVVQSHEFFGTTYFSGTTTVIFKLPSIDASGAIITDTYDYVGVYADGQNVYRSVDAALGSVRAPGTKKLTDVLAGLSFTYDNADIASTTNITINATTSISAVTGTTYTHLRDRVYLRNI